MGMECSIRDNSSSQHTNQAAQAKKFLDISCEWILASGVLLLVQPPFMYIASAILSYPELDMENIDFLLTYL